ncbi:MAG: hypothetical protein EA375_04305 [Acholeplasmataceae bacterium]|nr:MAG: hypothetical protein EA375_04305 [Acholeplasmataceae bacterium]
MKRTSYLLLLFMMFLLFVFACDSLPQQPPDDDSETFTVTFDSQGGSSVNAIEVDDGETITPPIPTKIGHTFIGWFLGPELSADAFDADVAITSNLILYARWQVNTYTITFVVNDGTPISTVDRTFGAPLDLPVTTRDGHTFAGWFTDAILTQTLTHTHMPAGHLLLYAKWQANMYTITFVVNDGTPIDSINRTVGAPLELPISTRDGHMFAGWFTDVDLTQALTYTHMPAHHMILYAKWEPVILETHLIEYWMLHEGEAVIALSFGETHAAALTSQGHLLTWGYNTYGQLGDGTTNGRRSPADITSHFNLQAGETIIQVSLGSQHSAALTSQGRVFTWGVSWSGRLGNGTPDVDVYSTPIDITDHFGLQIGETIIQLSLGAEHSTALTSAGRLFLWGKNEHGQLGDGTNTDRHHPIDITDHFGLAGHETIIRVSLGNSHSIALTSMDRVFTWGANSSGQLGDGSGSPRNMPTDITANFDFLDGETVESISAGRTNSAVLTSANRLFTWGNNVFGQIGDGTTIGRFTPTVVTAGFNLQDHETIIQVSFGYDYAAIITSLNRVFFWGYNANGELGIGTTNTEANPHPIDMTSGFDLSENETITQLSLSTSTSAALSSEGRVFTWGSNGFGKIGDGTWDDQMLPKAIDMTDLGATQFLLVGTDELTHLADIDPFKPEREGYVFSGWYTDETFTTLYAFGIMPDHDLTLFGYWIPADTSLVVNGDFSQPLEGTWELWFGDGGNSTAVIVDGVLVFDITDIGANWYSNHFFQTGLTLTQGVTLRLTFDARADIARTIVVKLEDTTFYGYIDQNVDITTEWTTYTIDLYMNMPTRTDGKLVFGAGNMSDINEATGVATTIYINNVSLIVIDSED